MLFHRDHYSIAYSPATVNGEHGYSYTVYCRERIVFEGWSRGRKAIAEREVREGINAREALLDCLKSTWRPSDERPAPRNSFNGDQS